MATVILPEIVIPEVNRAEWDSLAHEAADLVWDYVCSGVTPMPRELRNRIRRLNYRRAKLEVWPDGKSVGA